MGRQGRDARLKTGMVPLCLSLKDERWRVTGAKARSRPEVTKGNIRALCRAGCEILAPNSGNHQQLAEKDLCTSSLNYHRLKISGLWEVTGRLQGTLRNGGCGSKG